MTPDQHQETQQRISALGRRVWVALLVFVLAVLVAAAALAQHGISQARSRADELRDQNAANATTVLQQQQAISTLSTQVTQLGGTPSATAPSPGPLPTQTTQPPPPRVDVAQIVRDVLAALPAPRPGRDGRDGHTPTAAEVQAAVAAVCARRVCGPTDQAVAGAVAEYLIANPPPAGPVGPTGSPGRDGVDGHDGKDGRDGRDAVDGVGIADITIRQDGDQCVITVLLTNGATKELPWQCQAPAPTPVLPTLPGTEGGGN